MDTDSQWYPIYIKINPIYRLQETVQDSIKLRWKYESKMYKKEAISLGEICRTRGKILI